MLLESLNWDRVVPNVQFHAKWLRVLFLSYTEQEGQADRQTGSVGAALYEPEGGHNKSAAI